MSFLPWGRNEDTTERPVTRSEQKRCEKAEQELKSEGPSGSETESGGDSFEEAQTTPEITPTNKSESNSSSKEHRTVYLSLNKKFSDFLEL